MKLMWHYTSRYKKLLWLNLFCVFGFILIELGLPTLLAQMIDKGILKKDYQQVNLYGILMVTISLVGLIGLIALAYTGSRITTNIVRDIRDDIFKKVSHFSNSEYNDFGVSSLITRTTNDAFQVMTFMQMVLRTGFMTPIMFLASGVLIIRTSPSLSVFVYGAIPLLLIGVIVIGKLSEPMSTDQQKNLDGINLTLRENLTGLRVIRAFVREKFQESRFSKVNEAYTASSIRLYRLMAMAQPGFSFIFNIVFAFIIWFGAVEINANNLAIGSLIAFIEYIFHALFSFMLFASVFMMYPRAAVSAGRIQAVLDSKTTVKNPIKKLADINNKGAISFNDVTFAYPDSEVPVIRNVSFTANPGEVVAFIGSTGSGKSTLIQLIPRFFDATHGSITIDGIDVKNFDQADLRKKIGFIPQKAALFTGTIGENMRYGKADATDEEIMAAADIAQASEFINDRTDKLDSFLSEGGSNLSGGQKQRLAITRAIVRRPAIYIFDDSFSALDYATDAKLRHALKGITQQSTVLIVAQRVGTIMNADKIVVLNEGQVVGIGTHDELLKNNQIYQDIANSQLSKEELA